MFPSGENAIARTQLSWRFEGDLVPAAGIKAKNRLILRSGKDVARQRIEPASDERTIVFPLRGDVGLLGVDGNGYGERIGKSGHGGLLFGNSQLDGSQQGEHIRKNQQ